MVGLPEDTRCSILLREQHSLLSFPKLSGIELSDLSAHIGGCEFIDNLTDLTLVNGFPKLPENARKLEETTASYYSNCKLDLSGMGDQLVQEQRASIIAEIKALPMDRKCAILVAEQKSLLAFFQLSRLDLSDISSPVKTAEHKRLCGAG